MLDLVRRIGVRQLLNKPLRTLLSLVAVALGIGLAVAIAIINRSVLASFRASVDALAGTAALTVSAGDIGFPEDRLEEISRVPGVKSAIPRVEAWGYLAGDKTGKETVYILGVDMLREQAVRSYRSGDAEVMEDPLVFLNEPDSVILTKAFAASRGLAMGSSLRLATATGQITLVVRGLLDAEGPAKAYGGAVAMMDIDGARVMLGKEGKTDAIDIVPRAGVEPDTLKTALRSTLGPTFFVEAPEGYAHQLEQLAKPFQATLSFFGTMALLVGLFLLANSMGMSVAARQKEIGVLRALGATRGQIFVLLLAECVLLGAIGSFAGAYIGRALASFMVKDVAEAMTNQLSMKVTIDSLGFNSGVVLRAVFEGAAAATVAGFVPAVRATRIPPIVALQTHAETTEPEEGRSVSVFVGLFCIAYTVVSLAIPSLAAIPALAGLAQITGVVGVVLVSPALVQWIVSRLRTVLLSSRDVVARLAVDNILRYRRRTQSNVIGLTLGLLFVMLVAGVSHSMKETIMTWFTVNMRYDIIVWSAGKMMQGSSQPMNEALALELADVPGVRKQSPSVEGVRTIHTEYEGHTIVVRAYDEPDPSLHYWGFDMRNLSPDEAGKALYHSTDNTVLVSPNFALHFGRKAGESIVLNTPAGPTQFRIVGVVTDFASPEGVVYMSRLLYKELWRDPLVTAFGLYVAKGAESRTVRAEIDKRLGAPKNLSVVLNDELRAEFTETIDRSFAFTDSVQSTALFVALVSMFNTLTIGILSRTRELGMLRAIGMSRGQLARMLLLEAVIQGAVTAILAVVLGGALGYWLIAKSLPSTLGWVLTYTLPWSSMALMLGTGVLVAGLAGVYPSWRASRVSIVDALA